MSPPPNGKSPENETATVAKKKQFQKNAQLRRGLKTSNVRRLNRAFTVGRMPNSRTVEELSPIVPTSFEQLTRQPISIQTFHH